MLCYLRVSISAERGCGRRSPASFHPVPFALKRVRRQGNPATGFVLRNRRSNRRQRRVTTEFRPKSQFHPRRICRLQKRATPLPESKHMSQSLLPRGSCCRTSVLNVSPAPASSKISYPSSISVAAAALKVHRHPAMPRPVFRRRRLSSCQHLARHRRDDWYFRLLQSIDASNVRSRSTTGSTIAE